MNRPLASIPLAGPVAKNRRQVGSRWSEPVAVTLPRREDAPTSAAAHTAADSTVRGRAKAVEKYAPAVIFLLVTVFLSFDFADELAHQESTLHLAGMVVGIVLSLVGLVMMLRLLRASRAREQELAAVLDHTRADSLRWHEQASQMLNGLGALIDQQFAEWALSPSESEVGLLLLKGLSLKEIAAARRASEATVRQQAQAIYRKANLSGRADLSAFFLEDLLLPRTAGAQTPPPIAPPAERAGG